METLKKLPDIEWKTQRARPRDPSPTTKLEKDVGKGSRQLANISLYVIPEELGDGGTQFWKDSSLSDLEIYLLKSLVSVRVMSRDQVKALVYPERNLRTVNWRLKKLKEQKLIQRIPAHFTLQSVWTYTERGLMYLIQDLGLLGLPFDLDVPHPRALKTLALKHQLMIAETYVRFVSRKHPDQQYRFVNQASWQDGSKLRIQYGYGPERKFIQPDAWLGSSNQKGWLALLEIDRGTEDGPTFLRKIEAYRKCLDFHQQNPFPTPVIVICPSPARKQFLQTLLRSAPHKISRFAQNMVFSTIGESNKILNRFFDPKSHEQKTEKDGGLL